MDRKSDSDNLGTIAGFIVTDGLPDPRERTVIAATEAFRLLGIDRTTGYKAIQDGTFPVPVLRVGRLIRVPTAALNRVLRGEALPPAAGSGR
jgi:predicted DNA-binding transcriptional regulator AlpA